MFNKGLNTFYLKKFKKAASDIYRVITTEAGYDLQRFDITVNKTGSDCLDWITIHRYKNKIDAYSVCDKLRRSTIQKLVQRTKTLKNIKIGEIY